MITIKKLHAVQQLLQELQDYGQAHANEEWAKFMNAKISEALEKFEEDDDENYISLSGKSLKEIYTEVKEQEAKLTPEQLIQRLRTPNPLLDDLMNEDD